MSNAPSLPEKQQSSRKSLWIILAIVAVAALVAAFFLPKLFAGDKEQTVVKLGTTDASADWWPPLIELLEKENITLELVPFAEYPLPNPALAAGETDLNSFQHLDYLSNHNVATGDNLAVVGPTYIVPLPIYSAKYTDVAEIPEGEQIAIPNDPSNQARALRVLEAAGLVEIDADVSVPTPADITSGKVEVVAIEASQTAAALNDPKVAGSVVNNNFALDAGILDKAIFSLDPTDANSWPYINVIASRAGDEDNPVYQKVLELYHHPSVTEALVKATGNTGIVVTEDKEQVRDWLKQIEETKKAAE